MVISNLEIKRFAGIDTLKYVPVNKISVLAGDNGKGKSSFIKALNFLLNGEEKGDIIREPGQQTFVKAEIDGIEFARGRGGKDNTLGYFVNNRPVKKADFEEMLSQASGGVSADAMGIVPSSDAAMGMSSSELGRFLMKYIPKKAGRDDVIKTFKELKASDDVIYILERTLPDGEIDIPALEAFQKTAVEKRKAKKREAKDLEAVAKNPVADPGLKYEEAKEMLEDAVKALGKAEETQKLIGAYNKAVEAKKTQEGQIKTLKEQADAIKAEAVTAEEKAAINNAFTEAQAELNNAGKVKAGIQAGIATNKKVFESLDTDVCVLFHLNKDIDPKKAFRCTSPEKESLRAEFRKAIEDGEKTLALQDEAIKKAEARIADIRAQIKTLQDREAAYAKKQSILSQAEAIGKNPVAIPEKPDMPDIEALKIAKTNAEEAVAKCVAFRNYTEASSAVEKLKRVISAYDYIAKALDGKGAVMTGIMKSFLDLFEGVCRETASRFDYSFRFFVDDGIKFAVTPAGKDKKEVSYNELSAGEKEITNIIVLDMLNRLTGLRVLVLDNLDNLDVKAFGKVMATVSDPDFQTNYDHIVLAMVSHDDLMAKIPKDGVDMVM